MVRVGPNYKSKITSFIIIHLEYINLYDLILLVVVKLIKYEDFIQI